MCVCACWIWSVFGVLYCAVVPLTRCVRVLRLVLYSLAPRKSTVVSPGSVFRLTHSCLSVSIPVGASIEDSFFLFCCCCFFFRFWTDWAPDSTIHPHGDYIQTSQYQPETHNRKNNRNNFVRHTHTHGEDATPPWKKKVRGFPREEGGIDHDFTSSNRPSCDVSFWNCSSIFNRHTHTEKEGENIMYLIFLDIGSYLNSLVLALWSIYKHPNIFQHWLLIPPLRKEQEWKVNDLAGCGALPSSPIRTNNNARYSLLFFLCLYCICKSMKEPDDEDNLTRN